MNGWLIYDHVGRMRNAWFIDALCKYSIEQGLSLALIESEKLMIEIRDGRQYLKYDGREVPKPDFALVRTIDPFLSCALMSMGIKLFNSATVSEICNDKRKTHLFFSDLPAAKTTFSFNGEMDFSQFEYPVVLKSAAGHGGNEVFWIDSPESALDKAEIFAQKGVLLQEPVTPGRDVRVYVLDGIVLAAVERSSKTDFRSNFSLGGDVCLTKPTEKMITIIEKINFKLHPWFVGIDFIFDRDGQPLLNEIEDIVGTRMLYQLTELEVHKLMIHSLREHLL